jgi:hypothetical protein
MKLPSMIDDFKKKIASGQIIAHRETAITKNIIMFERIAHIWCEYEGYAKTQQNEKSWKGTMSIQLINENKRWLIYQFIWQDEDL